MAEGAAPITRTEPSQPPRSAIAPPENDGTQRRGDLRGYRPTPTTLLHVAVLVAAVCAGAGIALHLGQDANADLHQYHLYNAYAFLHGRFNYDVQPADFGTCLNPLIDIPNYMLIMHTSPRFAGATLGALQGLNVWLAFEITLVLLRDRIQSSVWRHAVALIVAAGALYGAIIYSEFGMSMNDSTASIPVLVGLWLVLKSTLAGRSDRSAFWMRNSGFLIVGMGVGLKLTNAPMAIGLVVAVLMVGRSLKQRVRQFAMAAAASAAGVLATSGYWFVVVWRARRNPTFPFNNAVFHSPYFPDYNFVDLRWTPKTWLDHLLIPVRLARLSTTSSELPLREPQFLVALGVLLVAGVIALVRRANGEASDWSPTTAVFITYFTVSFAVWDHQFGYSRYLLPLEPVYAAALLVALLSILRRVRVVVPVFLAAVVAISAFSVAPNWGRLPLPWRSAMFGPHLATQLRDVHGTVLMPGRYPLAFLVPYLPSDVRVIRFGGWVESPSMATPAYWALIRDAIAAQERTGGPFYALETTRGADHERTMLLGYGYRNRSCRGLVTYGSPKTWICRVIKG